MFFLVNFLLYLDEYDQCFQLYEETVKYIDQEHAKECVKYIMLLDHDLATDLFF